MTGYTLEDAAGKNPSQLVKSGKMEPAFYKNMWAALTGNQTWFGRIVNRRKNGQLYNEEMKITPFFLPGGKKFYFAQKREVFFNLDLLKQSDNENAEKLFETSNDIMVVLGKKGNILNINHRGARILGYKKEELLGKNWFDTIIPEKIREEVRNVFKSILEGELELVREFTNEIMAKDGKTLVFKWNNEFYVDDAGNVSAVISSGANITEVVQYSEELKQKNKMLLLSQQISKVIQEETTQERLLNGIIKVIKEESPIKSSFFVLLDKDKNILRSAYFGYDKTDFDYFLKKHAAERFQICSNISGSKAKYYYGWKEDLQECKNCPLFKYDKEGMIFVSKLELSRNSSCYWLVLTDKKRSNAENDLGFFETIGNNIRTALNNIEATETGNRISRELAMSERRFRNFFNMDHSANYISTPDGRIVNCNEAFLDLFGFKSIEEASKIKSEDLFYAGYSHDDFISELKRKRILKNREHRYKNLEGDIIEVRENTTGVFDEDDNLVMIQGFIIDITKEKENEKKLREALVKAKESESLKTAFLNNISHEIRTPMNHIMGFSGLMQTMNFDESTQKQMLANIENSSKELLETITNIVELSKIDSSDNIVNNSTFDLNSELKNIINEGNLLLAKTGSRKVVCKNDLSGRLFINSDKNRIRQILEILLSNAIKFSDKGDIEVSYELSDNALNISVKDEGIGIKKQHFELIFERFKKIVPQDKQNIRGTGIGLALAKEIVTKMGGEIGVESTYGLGSVFRFKLPVKTENTTGKKDDRTENEKKLRKMKKLKILIAEDDESNYQLLKILLKRYNPQIYRAWDGLEAINIVKEQKDLDVVLMDLKMPGMDGFIATGEIKRIRPGLPVIAQTAYALLGDEEKALNAGCDYYISKPINHLKLKETIDKALAKKS